jgi:hypothetical protein
MTGELRSRHRRIVVLDRRAGHYQRRYTPYDQVGFSNEYSLFSTRTA